MIWPIQGTLMAHISIWRSSIFRSPSSNSFITIFIYMRRSIPQKKNNSLQFTYFTIPSEVLNSFVLSTDCRCNECWVVMQNTSIKIHILAHKTLASQRKSCWWDCCICIIIITLNVSSTFQTPPYCTVLVLFRREIRPCLRVKLKNNNLDLETCFCPGKKMVMTANVLSIMTIFNVLTIRAEEQWESGKLDLIYF